MDDLWTMSLLGQEEPGFWRMLAPVAVIGALAVFRWLNEKAKQKERQQQTEDDARGQGEDEDGASQTRPTRPEQAQSEQRAPLPPQARRQQRRPGVAELSPAQPRQDELIIMANDVSVEAAQRQFQQEQQRLREEAIRQARALQAKRHREAARRKTIELRTSGQFPPPQTAPGRELFQARTALLARGQTISRPQIRRAIVWAEILGPPRALRSYEELFFN